GSPCAPRSSPAAPVEPRPSRCAPPAPPTASPRPATSPTGPIASTLRSSSPSNQPTSPDGSVSSAPGAAPEDGTAFHRWRGPAVGAGRSGRPPGAWVARSEAWADVVAGAWMVCPGGWVVASEPRAVPMADVARGTRVVLGHRIVLGNGVALESG